MATIVYSAFSTQLQISGDAIVRSDNDIRITNVKLIDQTNGVYETYNNKYTKDTTSMFVTLPSNSSITYEVIITNKASDSYLIDLITQESHTNQNADVNMSLNINDIVNANSTKTFTITITNNTDLEQQETLVYRYGFKLNSFTVTFDANGGSVSTLSKQVSYGSNYGALPIPRRDGYTFKGWNGKNILNLEVNESLPSDTSLSNASNRIFEPNTYVKGIARNNYYYPSRLTYLEQSSNYLKISAIYDYGIGYPFVVNPNEKYTISFELNASSPTTSWPGFSPVFYKQNGTYITFYNDHYEENGIKKMSFTTPNDSYYLILNFYSRENSSVIFKNIQLEDGDEATTYEPYYILSSTNVVQSNNHILKAIWEENE